MNKRCQGICAKFRESIRNKNMYRSGNVYCPTCGVRFNTSSVFMFGKWNHCPCCHVRIRTTRLGKSPYDVIDYRPRVDMTVQQRNRIEEINAC